MVISLAALAIMGGLGLLGNLITTAANEAHSKAAREDEQRFNKEEAEIARQFNRAEAEKQRLFESTEAATARSFSSEEAQKQRDFEKMMSDTSYQRQRADLEAAGYNPASIGLTQGASTPSGATGMASSAKGVGASGVAAHSGGASVPQMQDYFSNLMSSAIAYKMSQDKNFTNKAIAEMYTSNARQMNQMTNATKKALAELKKIQKVYNGKGELKSELVSETAVPNGGFTEL